MYIEVAIPVPLRRLFDYLPPKDESGGAIKPGSRVIVPFGRRQLIGIVTARKQKTEIPAAQLKRIHSSPDTAPLLPADILELGRWTATYYHQPVGECLQLALPPRLRETRPPSSQHLHIALAADADPEILPKRAARQKALFDFIGENAPLSRSALKEAGFDSTLLKKLLDAGLIAEVEPVAAARPATTVREPPPMVQLNREQSTAVDAVNKCFGSFATLLLEGITGSGKTEVYLRCIAECLQQGNSALVLIPEIGLTPQTLARFEQRFPGEVVALHSGLAEGERLRGWQQVANGGASILLGTRSAVFTPLPNLGLVIVDEEHDASFKAQDGCRYSARDVAVKRGAIMHCPVLLGSATPSLETLKNAMDNRYQWLHLRERAGDAKPPQLSLVDIRDANMDANISTELRKRLTECLAAGEQALIFLNRRGFAPALQCNTCGWLADCKHCDARMTVHWRHRRLHCHHCDSRTTLPQVCPSCSNPNLMFRGPGTERLEMTLNEWFPRTDIIRVDRDTTSRKSAMADHVATIREGRPAILVGTQMLAKGHHFPNVTLVGVIDIDGALFSADLKAAERCGQLLIQVAGRSGRGAKPGRVLIQSRNPEHPALHTLVTRGYPEFARQMLTERRNLHLPPYGFLAAIRADANKLEVSEGFLHDLRKHMPEVNGVTAIGPLPAPMTRKAGRFRAVLLLSGRSRKALHSVLGPVVAAAEATKNRNGLNWQVDVDPAELF